MKKCTEALSRFSNNTRSHFICSYCIDWYSSFPHKILIIKAMEVFPKTLYQFFCLHEPLAAQMYIYIQFEPLCIVHITPGSGSTTLLNIVDNNEHCGE